jgi:RimJ/RimL family protein N-acetyltransferase
MFELSNNDYHIVLPLIKTLEFNAVYAYAVIEHIQPGRIFVNRLINPTCSLIVNNGGKYTVIGDYADVEFMEDLTEFLSERSNHSNYYDLYTSSEDWIEPIKSELVGQVVTLSHTTFTFNKAKYQLLKQVDIAASFVIEPINGLLFDQYRNEHDHTYKRLWSSTESFMKQGFGVCIRVDEQFASVCISFNVGNGFAEIDIITAEQYRKQGLATLTCSAFIDHCFANNRIPSWGCDSGNQASLQLAAKLGFEKNNNYKMLWWHENKDVISNYLKRFSYE